MTFSREQLTLLLPDVFQIKIYVLQHIFLFEIHLEVKVLAALVKKLTQSPRWLRLHFSLGQHLFYRVSHLRQSAPYRRLSHFEIVWPSELWHR